MGKTDVTMAVTGRRLLSLVSVALVAVAFTACRKSNAETVQTSQRIIDSMKDVIAADRETYTTEVVERLQNQERVIKASEHFREEKLLPLPAQMLRMGAERARAKNPRMTYGLVSLWPINKKNGPRTEAERQGLQSIAATPEKAHYAEEELAGKRYFTGIYADTAVSEACASCHNMHDDSPRKDFKEGDVMGALVIRLALD